MTNLSIKVVTLFGFKKFHFYKAMITYPVGWLLAIYLTYDVIFNGFNGPSVGLLPLVILGIFYFPSEFRSILSRWRDHANSALYIENGKLIYINSQVFSVDMNQIIDITHSPGEFQNNIIVWQKNGTTDKFPVVALNGTPAEILAKLHSVVPNLPQTSPTSHLAV